MFYGKKMIIFIKHSILDVWNGSQRNTWDCLIYAKLIIVFTPNLESSPYLDVIHGSTTFKQTKGSPSTAWKVSKYGVISGRNFPVFGLNTGKYGPKIAPHLDTFHPVKG